MLPTRLSNQSDANQFKSNKTQHNSTGDAKRSIFRTILGHLRELSTGLGQLKAVSGPGDPATPLKRRQGGNRTATHVPMQELMKQRSLSAGQLHASLNGWIGNL
jgi:hypothetical protein